MPRTCTVCAHLQRSEIDRALTESTPNRRIAAQYGVSEQSVRRHRADHLPGHVARAKEAERVADADDLLGHLRALRLRTMNLLDRAEAAGDYRTALQGIREARSCVALLLEVEGELDRRNVVNILVAPEWVSIRAVIVTALADHPEARLAVAGALASLDTGTAS